MGEGSRVFFEGNKGGAETRVGSLEDGEKAVMAPDMREGAG